MIYIISTALIIISVVLFIRTNILSEQSYIKNYKVEIYFVILTITVSSILFVSKLLMQDYIIFICMSIMPFVIIIFYKELLEISKQFLEKLSSQNEN